MARLANMLPLAPCVQQNADHQKRRRLQLEILSVLASLTSRCVLRPKAA
jgi:hypothetical protein